MPEHAAATRPPIRVLIVDDHPVVRNGIRGMLAGPDGFEVVGEAGDGFEAIDRTRILRPDVVLMDLRMPGLDGVAATRRIVDDHLARVLVLTTYDSEGDVLPAIEAGATGYVLKDISTAELRRAVLAAATGEAVLAPSAARQVLDQVRSPGRPVLSERELEVLRAVAGGAGNRDVAAELFISQATVKTHLLHIYARLGVSDRAAAVAAAYERGLLTPGAG